MLEYRRKVDMETVLDAFNAHAEEDRTTERAIKNEIAKVAQIHDKDFESIETFHTDTGARLKKLEIAIYGDDDDEDDLGMKKQNDEMYKIITTTKVVTGLLGNAKTIALWLLAIGAMIALFKGWLAGLIAWVTLK